MSNVTLQPRRWWNTKIAVAVAFTVAGAIFTSLAFQLPTMSRGQPGSGLFPQLLGAGWVVLALINLALDIFTEWRARRAAGAETPQEALEPLTVLWMILLVLAFVVLFEPLGAVISSMLFGVAAIFLLKREDRVRGLITAVVMPVVLVVLIQVILKQSLPVGPLGFIPFLDH
ncbi:MAG TPA: tripartite tricarboxylate transporter TctB family protein [Devosia sp.]|nr:tripartite tricarboxylate transporter TctB family protein [Devosia sp.]